MKKHKFFYKFIIVLFYLSILSGLIYRPAMVKAQDNPDDKFVDQLLAKMSPEEKIGQLFLVSFQGNTVTADSPIHDLITNHHIGGVILNTRNNNFTYGDTISSAQELIYDLQQSVWSNSLTRFPDVSPSATSESNYVPLFISISQDGDSFPYDQIINGVTTMPNEMAIGATWKRAYAENVGKVLGQELSALGFNLYLGPLLDVLDLPYVEGGDDLGTRTFGGDPYWVGELGKSFISGIHNGSENSMAVIAKHFPGRGSSDRLPDEEVATVRKSLEQLKQIELAPFFAVTGDAPDKLSTTDGLLVSHIRYQGFQGNIRATTRPVSFDQAAQEQLMALPEFSSWRDQGGIIVSDNLGSNAVRKFFDPFGESYDPRQIARSAFLSGNDLLLLDLYIDARDLDPYATTLRILEFFTQKYLEDTAFAQRVDSSVKRILRLKNKLYPQFSIDRILPDADNLSNIGTNQNISFEVANQSAVLMSPDFLDLSAVMPRPPQITERVLFFTERVSANQCSECPSQDILSVDAFEKAVLRLYGPGAGEQVIDARMSSFSFSDLTRYLNDPKSYSALDSELRNANWIIFSFIKPDPKNSDSLAMKKFLSNRTDLLRDKKIVAFGFNAPYYLDATDISKLTAYYVLFSKTPAFIDLAARILFQEATANGALPVSVPGIGYELISAMSPDPEQVIPLYLDNIPVPTATATTEISTPEPDFVPTFALGETVSIRTGIIVDHNQNPVPDGTVVRFLINYLKDPPFSQQFELTTLNGVARLSYRVQNTGLLEIRATSDPATKSKVIQLEIPAPEGAEATIVVLSTPQPTETKVPTITPTLSPTLEVTMINPNKPKDFPSVMDWFAVMILIIMGSGAFYLLSYNRFSMRWVLRYLLIGIIGGVLTYILVLSQINANKEWILNFRTVNLLVITIIGLILGWLVTFIWHMRNRRSYKKLFTNR
ncbi:MAG: hypothetical protein BGO78_04725 [Chloroflexi bacterium 44-23]|nr:MAG: hypothetical protein BGO78_04725 [Chloroflexi bacterium 44-23]